MHRKRHDHHADEVEVDLKEREPRSKELAARQRRNESVRRREEGQRNRTPDRDMEVPNDPHRVVDDHVHAIRSIDQAPKPPKMKRIIPRAAPVKTGSRQGSHVTVCRNPRLPARRAAISNDAKTANAVMSAGTATPNVSTMWIHFQPELTRGRETGDAAQPASR